MFLLNAERLTINKKIFHGVYTISLLQVKYQSSFKTELFLVLLIFKSMF